jgi:hypothetical protein
MDNLTNTFIKPTEFGKALSILKQNHILFLVGETTVCPDFVAVALANELCSSSQEKLQYIIAPRYSQPESLSDIHNKVILFSNISNDARFDFDEFVWYPESLQHLIDTNYVLLTLSPEFCDYIINYSRLGEWEVRSDSCIHHIYQYSK